jgi:hypothetical protein
MCKLMAMFSFLDNCHTNGFEYKSKQVYICSLKYLMTGKQTGAPRAEHGLGYSVVSELSSNHRNKHHHIVLDNAFTSPVLCHDLYRHDI